MSDIKKNGDVYKWKEPYLENINKKKNWDFLVEKNKGWRKKKKEVDVQSYGVYLPK